MKQLNTLRAFFLHLLIERVLNCHDRAVRRMTAIEADRYFHNTLAQYYQTEAAKVDPTIDWWGYAHLRDKQQEQEDKFELASASRVKCIVQVIHLREQLDALRAKQFVG